MAQSLIDLLGVEEVEGSRSPLLGNEISCSSSSFDSDESSRSDDVRMWSPDDTTFTLEEDDDDANKQYLKQRRLSVIISEDEDSSFGDCSSAFTDNMDGSSSVTSLRRRRSDWNDDDVYDYSDHHDSGSSNDMEVHDYLQRRRLYPNNASSNHGIMTSTASSSSCCLVGPVASSSAPKLYRLTEQTTHSSEIGNTNNRVINDWEEILSRCRTHPHESTWQDPYDGWNVLHMIFLHDPPEQVVRAVLEACKCSSSNHPVDGSTSPLAKTWRGCTPLHIACYFGASKDIIQFLINSDPYAIECLNDRGETPLLCALGSRGITSIDSIVCLLNAADDIGALNKVTSHLSQWGATPLSEVCNRWRDKQQQRQHEDVTSSFLEKNTTCASALKFVAPHQCCLNHKAVEKKKDNIRLLHNPNMIAAPQYDNNNDDEWNKLSLVLKATYYSQQPPPPQKNVTTATNNDDDFLIVHAAIEMACPLEVITHAIHLHPHQTKTPNTTNLQYPLHIAAQSPHIHNHNSSSKLCMEQILNTYPASACYIDNNGKLPFHLALERGRTWNTGVETLLKANPNVLRVRDPNTKLFPFMKAAASSSVVMNHQKHCDSGGDLNTIYCLLREGPDQLLPCVLNDSQHTNTLLPSCRTIFCHKRKPDCVDDDDASRKSSLPCKKKR